ncbi:hypothetical protein EHM92_04470, partial [bacterium]
MKRSFLSLTIMIALMANMISTPDSGAQAGTKQTLRAETMRCEYLNNPLGIGTSEPRLSWTIASQARGMKQQAYQILVATRKERLTEKKADLWNSGKVKSDRMFQIIYAGKPLRSDMRCFWMVRIY